MRERTCVACDSPLEGEAILVRIAGRCSET